MNEKRRTGYVKGNSIDMQDTEDRVNDTVSIKYGAKSPKSGHGHQTALKRE